MSQYKPSVFISYRPDSSTHLATVLYQQLRKHGYDVFLDTGRLGSLKAIFDQIAQRDSFIPVLSPGTLVACVDPKDKLRRELEYAVEKGLRLIPLFDEGFELEKEKQYLPETLSAELEDSQPIQVVAGHTIAELVKPLDMMLKQPNAIKTTATQSSKLLESKLREDDVYTLLYDYVGAFAPTPDLMVYTGKKQSPAEIKSAITQSLNQLRRAHHIDLSSVAQRVFDLVNSKQYSQAKGYLREQVQKLEGEIKSLR